MPYNLVSDQEQSLSLLDDPQPFEDALFVKSTSTLTPIDSNLALNSASSIRNLDQNIKFVH